eukprot:g51720.t1
MSQQAALHIYKYRLGRFENSVEATKLLFVPVSVRMMQVGLLIGCQQLQKKHGHVDRLTGVGACITVSVSTMRKK